MLGKLFLLFTIVPVVELYLLISIGEVLGAVPTLGIVVVTGLLGAALAKHEGLRVLRAWQEATARGEMPKDGVVASLLVLVGGVLLVTPGVLTDVTGLLLLVPATRRAVARILQRRLQHKLEVHSVQSLGARVFVDGVPVDDEAPAGEVIDLSAEDVHERAGGT